MELQINMMSTDDLAELARIRQQADDLQRRYNAILARYAKPAGGAAVPTAAPTPPAPTAPIPIAVPVPPPLAPAGASPTDIKPPPFAPPPLSAAAPSTATLADLVKSTPPGAAPIPVPQAAPVAAPAPGSGAGQAAALADATADVLRKAGRPLRFEEIFQQLQAMGAPMPAEKPMLLLRKVLYSQKRFQTVKGAFTLSE